MYHSSQSSQNFTQLAQLPLAKFSYTTTSLGHNGPLNWSHVIGDGELVGTFEKWTALGSSGRVILKIFRELDIFEEIDLTQFVREANSTQSKQKPCFAVIVKLPCLAVKYPSGSTYLRRFQIKFSSDSDYYTALAILSDIKCPFSESNIGSASSGRKLNSSSWNLGAPARETPGIGNVSSSNSTIFPLQSSAIGSGAIPNTGGPTPSLSSHTALNFPGQFKNHYNGNLQQSEPSLHARSSPSTLSRPSTATACHDPQALNQILPPKRELPFSKPNAKKPRPVPQEKQSNPAANQPASKSTQLLQSTSSTPSIDNNPQHQGSGQQYSNQNSKICILRVPNAPSPTPTSTPKPTQTRHIIETQHPQSEPQPQLQPQSDSVARTLAAYVSDPTPERISFLEHWMATAIEDDKFMRLCQDMEGVWGRFAFGRSHLPS